MSYHANVTREGKWWMVAIPEIDGLTQARRLGEAEQMAREYIASATETPIDQVDVVMEFEDVAGIDVRTVLVQIKQNRDSAGELEAKAREQAERLAKALAEQNIPVRDIGTLMGVTFQRAHQLVTAGSKS